MIDFYVLGSGISGSTIANLLLKKYKVEIIDKARGVGGRSSNKKIGKGKSFDHGLQYFSSEEKEFNKFLQPYFKLGVLKHWGGNHLDFTLKKKKLSKKIIGKNANNDLAKYLTRNIKKFLDTEITRIQFKNNYWEVYSKTKVFFSKNLIISFPFEQTKKILKGYLNTKLLGKKIKMMPNLTLLIEGKINGKISLSSLKFNNKIISWAANENSKNRFNSNNTLWTVQTTENFSKKYIDLYKKKNKYVSKLILKEFCKITGYNFDLFRIVKLHGWKYSYNKQKLKNSSIWIKKFNVGICGDWFLGPQADSAWKSARSLFSKIKKNPPKN